MNLEELLKKFKEYLDSLSNEEWLKEVEKATEMCKGEMTNYCRLTEECVNYSKDCGRCWRSHPQPILGDFYQDYIPVCPYCKLNCIHDPAFIKKTDPEYYKLLFEELLPKDAVIDYCKDCDGWNMYDDECK